MLRPGEYKPRVLAADADLRTDIPAYRLYRGPEPFEQLTDLMCVWRDDLVAFLLGCSFTFESALSQAGIPLRHLEQGSNVPMYITGVACHPVGVFAGPLVVSMRPVPDGQVALAEEITKRYPLAHGGPVQIGEPELLGIRDLGDPDFGDAVPIREGETPVFWACGTTPQAIAIRSELDLVITHAPGHMFVTDLQYWELEVGTASRNSEGR
jgi:uncharacterized protein YcsI (UPF0317 family)